MNKGLKGLLKLGDKAGYVTKVVPEEMFSGVAPLEAAPRLGDLALCEVLNVKRHRKLETRESQIMAMFPGDRLAVAFGDRYAPESFGGQVPRDPVEECDLLGSGGVIGEVKEKRSGTKSPTRLRVLGIITDSSGDPVSTRDHGLPPRTPERRSTTGGGPEVVLVAGSAMDSGKTTTTGAIVRSLRRDGHDVAVGKVLGIAGGRDDRYHRACGGWPVLDFLDVGYTSTPNLEARELAGIYGAIVHELSAAGPDYIIPEIGGGLLQGATQRLLGVEAVRETVDHVFFCAGDSLSAESGNRCLRELGLPLRATSGLVTVSPLTAREAERATGVPCLGINDILDVDLPQILPGKQHRRRAVWQRNRAAGTGTELQPEPSQPVAHSWR